MLYSSIACLLGRWPCYAHFQMSDGLPDRCATAHHLYECFLVILGHVSRCAKLHL